MKSFERKRKRTERKNWKYLSCFCFSIFQIKQRQHTRRHHEFSREEALEAEQRRKEEREALERRRQQEAEAPKEESIPMHVLLSREDDYHKAIEKGIKEQFIGNEKRHRRPRFKRSGDLQMEWSNEDDTSEKDNPLYAKRAKVHLAFGKGYVVRGNGETRA